MWYAFVMDDGLRYMAPTKAELLRKIGIYDRVRRIYAGQYEVESYGETYTTTHYLYNSEETARRNGWGWSFDDREGSYYDSIDQESAQRT